MTPEPLKGKSTSVEEICSIIIDKIVEAMKYEIERLNLNAEIDYTNVNIVKEQTKVEVGKEVIFDGDVVKSAVEGLIKFHEDRIEELIDEFKWNFPYGFEKTLEKWELENYSRILENIVKEYESIMAIEHWLEDAL